MAKFFGLDLGSTQIKVCRAEPSGRQYRLKALAAASSVNSLTEEAVRAAVAQAGIRLNTEVNLALPEGEVFTRIVSLPRLSEAELNSAIRFEAEQYVPLSLEEVELFHQILPAAETLADPKLMKVLLIAIPKERLNQLTGLLDAASLIPRSLETELFSLSRILADPGRYQLILLLSHKSTDVMAVYKGETVLLHSFPGGGLALTKSLVTELNLSEMQAEQYKHTYGLRPDLLEGRVAAVLLPFISVLVDQVNKIYQDLNAQGYKKNPEQIVLAGGGSLLPGLTGYLVKQLNTEVVIADPFRQFIKDENFAKLVSGEANPQWSVAVGLAVKGQ